MSPETQDKLMTADEAVVMLALAQRVLECHFAGAMLTIIAETSALVASGSAAQHASCAIEYGNFATRANTVLARRVFAFCSNLLWDVEPVVT